MHIKKKTSQSRRDFTAIYSCGHCGAEMHGGGYDDSNFHEQVIPSMECATCGKTEPASSVADVPAHVTL
jgi:hypothetical protein